MLVGFYRYSEQNTVCFNKKQTQFNLPLSVARISSCVAFVSCVGKKNGRVERGAAEVFVPQLAPQRTYFERVPPGHRILPE